LGDAVQPVLEFSGLNPDQLTPANETASSAGHTIRVTGGFADPTRTVVLIEVDGQHPLPNKHQTCCEVEARLTDQFGVSYAQRHNLDVLTLAFEPLTGPASRVGARLTLHVTQLQPLQQPNTATPAPIVGYWTLHLTLIEHPKSKVDLPAGGTSGGVTYRFTSISLSGLQLTVHATMGGQPIDSYVQQHGTPQAPPDPFIERYVRPSVTGESGQAAMFHDWGFSWDPRGKAPYTMAIEFTAELPAPGRYTIKLGTGPDAFTTTIDAT
jgi:hypothetical protein